MPGGRFAPALERLEREQQATIELAEEIVASAARDEREMTPPELEQIQRCEQRHAELETQIAPVRRLEAAAVASDTATASLVRAGRTRGARPEEDRGAGEGIRPDVVYRSVGEYWLDLIRSKLTPEDAQIIPGQYGDVVGMAQNARDRIQRALADVLTGDVSGMMPAQVVGPIVTDVNAVRPLVSRGSTNIPVTAPGLSFLRPRLTQHTAVGKQATQKTEVTTQKYTATADTITWATFAGAVDVAMQLVDLGDPTFLDLLFADLRDMYALATEEEAADVLQAGITAGTAASDLPAAPTAAEWYAALSGAAVDVMTAVNQMPDTLYMSPDQWARMYNAVDTTGRQIFPAMGPMNAAGSVRISDGGDGLPAATLPDLRVVVAPALDAGWLAMGIRKYFETYERRGGELRALRVDLLGWDIGYYGYFQAKVTKPTAFSRIHDVA